MWFFLFFLVGRLVLKVAEGFGVCQDSVAGEAAGRIGWEAQRMWEAQGKVFER